MDHADVACLVWLSAACIAHYRQFRKDQRHQPIFTALMVSLIANALAIGIHPSRGFLPICVALLAPTACLYGIVGACRACERNVPVMGFVVAFAAWVFSHVHVDVYPWAVLFGWGVLATTAWIVVLQPQEEPEGVTRWSAFALAASLLADLPGVYAWARTGRWHAEQGLSIVSVVVLATLPRLWRLRTSELS